MTLPVLSSDPERGISRLLCASIAETARLLRRREISPVELAGAELERIDLLNPRLNAFITVLHERALAQARRAEREILRGQGRGPLHGIPVSLKDNFWTRGVRTTAGAKILSDFVPAQNSEVAARLADAGAVLLGKTNLHEFAYGVTCDNPHFGAVRNPWDLSRIPGGSSGGSAAAVAAGMCFVSVGTDTGGSIRIPAAACGVAGLKPTRGRVSCFGVVPLSHTLDHAGPLARSVSDVAMLLGAIAGYDARDPYSVRRAVPDYVAALRQTPRRLRLAWPSNFFFDRVDPEVRRAITLAARQFEKLGGTVDEVKIPPSIYALEATTQIAVAEAAEFHHSSGFFPRRRRDYTPDLRKRLQAGCRVRAMDYISALALRDRAVSDFARTLKSFDAMLAPTIPVPATKVGQGFVRIGKVRETVRAALLRLNRPANLAGFPSISVPCGFTQKGLPVGFQLIGKPWEEARLLQAAFLYEQARPWRLRHPLMADRPRPRRRF